MSSSSQPKWSPFDCLAMAEQTEAGLLKPDGSEVELLVVHEFVELRAAVAEEPMVPMTAENQPDETKSPADWIDRAQNLTLTVTTHRVVFWKIDEFTQKRQARYLHLSNVFVMEEETAYFKSPKIILTTAFGDLIIAFMKATTMFVSYDSGNKALKNRDECLKQMQTAVRRQQWEQDAAASTKAKQKKSGVTSRKVGVDAVISSATMRHKQAAALTDSAFDGDAESLLQEATELVRIIHKYVATLDRQQADGSDDADKLVGMLQDMGMTSALSKADFRGREDAYYEQLARQLADFLRPKFKLQKTSVMTLTDVYCLFNRARGSHLLSPEDLLHACQKMESLRLNMSVQTFPSGLKVLQDDTAVNETLLAEQFLKMAEDWTDGLTALAVSRQFHVSPVLAMEQLQVAERAEVLVRDETLESTKFFPNQFKMSNWLETYKSEKQKS